MLAMETEGAVEAKLADLKAELQENKPSGQPVLPREQPQPPWPARLESVT